MKLRLKTKFTLTTSLLVLGVVALTSTLYVITLTHQVIRQAEDRAQQVAQKVFFQADRALADAVKEGAAPASESPADLREYVRQSLFQNVGLHTVIDAELGYGPLIYEVSIVDGNDTALVSSDARMLGQPVPRRIPLAQLARSNFVDQLRIIYGPPQVYAVVLPFNLGKEPFGEIRIAAQTGLLRSEVSPGLRRAGWVALGAVLLSTLLAAVVSQVSLAPLARISAQLDRISAGEFDLKPLESGDELGQVSTKITQIGQQLRGVREIFSTLRENLNQIMSGLEDGLLLFTPDGRAVLVSPAVEKFLGTPADALLGRRVSEIFPAGHPLREALRIEGDQLQPVAAEVDLNGAARPEASGRRAGVSVQVITEGGSRMGALVTLRDLES